jgi:hypothetical protein
VPLARASLASQLRLKYSLMNNNYIGVDLDLFRQPKIQRLEIKLGKQGVAIFLQLYLKLAENEGVLSLEDLPIFEREFFIKQEILKSVIFDFELFEIKDQKITNKSLDEKMTKISLLSKNRSEAGKAGAEKRWSNRENNSKAISNAIAKPLAKNSNKRKEKETKQNEIKENEIKEILNFYNETFSKNFKTAVGWEKNFEFWLTHYNLDEIKTAIRNLNHPNWWANKPKNGEPAELAKLDFLFRRSNSKGDCDYIGELLNLGEIENKQEPENVYRMSRSKFATEEELQRELAYYAEYLPQWKVILID